MPDQLELSFFDEKPVERTAAEITRTFLGWGRPLLTLATEYLTREWTGGTLDLSAKVVVVPTRQAGRRLRESLALRAAEHDAVVLPPVVVAPDFLLSPSCLPQLDRAVATRAEVVVAWAETVLRSNLNEFRHVFPIDPVERTLSWALRTADDLLSVQSLLGEAGRTMQSAAKLLAEEGLEPERWAELARLERLMHRRLHQLDRIGPQAARRDAAHDGVLPEGTESVLVIGVPDPPPLFCTALRNYAQEAHCEIAVHAPDDLADAFDEFGRPVVSEWLERQIELPPPEHHVHEAANPGEQARQTCELLPAGEQLASLAAVGVPDAEVLLPLEEAFAARGQATFNPAGQSVATHPLVSILRSLQRIALSDGFLPFLDLLRVPGVAQSVCAWEATPDRPEIAPAALLTELDAFQRDHLPESLDAARRINNSCRRSTPALFRAASWMHHWRIRLEREPLWEALPEFLNEIYSSTDFRLGQPADDAFAAVSELLHGILDTLEAGLLAGTSLAPELADRLALILFLLERETIYADREPNALDLQGWLELLWEDAPQLVLTGMNDGYVPETILGHAYIPDAARRLLGLRHNGGRHARDAYLLTALLASRHDHGRIDLLFGRQRAAAEPLRPSRLLFACPEEELPERVQQLFGDDLPTAEAPPWKLTWQLTPPGPNDEMRIFSRISVTAFRAYLACPFRFYLRHGLRMERDDGPRIEMDARNFGTLCHEVLEEFAASNLQDSDREEEIGAFFSDTLSTLVRQEYGERIPVPLLIQQDSAHQRLSWWAAVEAEQRRKGWRIIGNERNLASEDQPWLVGGLQISGKIDRIEQHSDGTIRVIDFKTGRSRNPREVHLRRPRRHEDPASFPAWMTIPAGRTVERWTDLQLPLYVLALQELDQAEKVVAGYATLGRAKSEVDLKIWEDLDTPLLNSARACAEGVIASILARKFWPPVERVDYDDYQDILLGEPAETVDPVHLQAAEIPKS